MDLLAFDLMPCVTDLRSDFAPVMHLSVRDSSLHGKHRTDWKCTNDEVNKSPSMTYCNDPWYVCLRRGKIPTERHLTIIASADLKVAMTISSHQEMGRIHVQGM